MIMSDLPTDLVEEILCRVPGIYLKQLRSTCKLWNTLLKNNRRFTEKHFHEASKPYVLLKDRHGHICPVIVNLNVASPSLEVKNELCVKNFQFNLEQDRISTIFYCDGLLLCTTKNDRLVVWNPYLGKTKWIQLKGNYETRPCEFALGYQYNESCRIYKILMCFEPRHDDVGFEIYEFRSDSWKFVPDKNTNYYYCINRYSGVSLKGNSYWLTCDSSSPQFLLCFDYTTERFKRLKLPLVSNYDTKFLSVVREEQLSMLCHSHNRTKMKIWITSNIHTEAKLVWRKSFKVHLKCRIPFANEKCLSSLIDEEMKVAVCCMYKDSTMYKVNILGEDNAYDTEILREVPFSEEDKAYIPWWRRNPIIFNYVPSLVQI